LCEHVNNSEHHLTEARSRASYTVHAASNGCLMMRHTSWKSLAPPSPIYKGDSVSPSRYDSFSTYFYTFNIISYTDLNVGVLTCLQTPSVPPLRLHQHHLETQHCYRCLHLSVPDTSKSNPTVQLSCEKHRLFFVVRNSTSHKLNTLIFLSGTI